MFHVPGTGLEVTMQSTGTRYVTVWVRVHVCRDFESTNASYIFTYLKRVLRDMVWWEEREGVRKGYICEIKDIMDGAVTTIGSLGGN